MPQFTITGLTARQGSEVAKLLQKQLSTYNDLHLTLKHVHWNVVGPSFIGVHEMIDPQVIAVRGYADEVAERIAALGASPQGTPEAIVRDRAWDDYPSAATLSVLIWARSTWSIPVSLRTSANASSPPKNLTP
jgi:starvation-inducible DNA-binding protein